jgi:hypothetical protein
MSRRGTLLIALALASTVAVGLAGCDSQPEAKSIAFYMSHPVEREDLMAACKSMGDVRESDVDCTNAGKAWLASWGVRPVRPTAASAAN